MLVHYTERLSPTLGTFLGEISLDRVNGGHLFPGFFFPQVLEGLVVVMMTSPEVCGFHGETHPP